MLVVSVASYGADQILYSLMEDDRIVLKLAEMEQTLYEECVYIAICSEQAWMMLVTAFGCSAAPTFSAALAASVATWACIHLKFRPCSRLPWILAVGNIAANLASLAMQEEEPTELVTFKIWTLLRLGYCTR